MIRRIKPKITMMREKAKAKAKLDRGPAAETKTLSRLRFRKYWGLTGTGLAHPKRK